MTTAEVVDFYPGSLVSSTSYNWLVINQDPKRSKNNIATKMLSVPVKQHEFE